VPRPRTITPRGDLAVLDETSNPPRPGAAHRASPPVRGVVNKLNIPTIGAVAPGAS
jgi:hypothetical protein